MKEPHWDKIGDMTVDDLVYETKFTGSAVSFYGFTTPEKWPFAVIIAVASPGNESVMEMVADFHRKMAAMTHSLRVDRKPPE